MTKKKEKVVPYELIDNSKKQASDKPFSNLVGYEGKKEEETIDNNNCLENRRLFYYDIVS